MERSDSQYAQAKLAQLKSEYQVEVVADWADSDGQWTSGTWSRAELDRLHSAIDLMVEAMGGKDKFVHHLGGVTVRKSDIGTHGGGGACTSCEFIHQGILFFLDGCP